MSEADLLNYSNQFVDIIEDKLPEAIALLSNTSVDDPKFEYLTKSIVTMMSLLVRKETSLRQTQEQVKQEN